MRPVVSRACTFALVCCSLAVASAKVPTRLTVVLDFKGSHSDQTIREMKRESGIILGATGVQLDWQFRNAMTAPRSADMVVMTFNGSCQYDRHDFEYEFAGGPYAITRIVNGEVQPFGEVDCDKVLNYTGAAMTGSDFGNGNTLLGRALGRVVAHELVHMLTKSVTHGLDGTEKAALSGRQLIAARLPLSAFDIDRVKR